MLSSSMAGNMGEAQHAAAMQAQSEETRLRTTMALQNIDAEMRDSERAYQTFMEEAGDAQNDASYRRAKDEARRELAYQGQLESARMRYQAQLAAAQQESQLWSTILGVGGAILGGVIAGPIGAAIGGGAGGAAGQAIGPHGANYQNIYGPRTGSGVQTETNYRHPGGYRV